MLSTKLTFLLVIIGCCNLSVINGQFGFSRPFFQNSQGAQGGFTNQNTNFNQHRGGSFGVVAELGSGQSSTNFQQHNSGAGNHCYFVCLFSFKRTLTPFRSLSLAHTHFYPTMNFMKRF